MHAIAWTNLSNIFSLGGSDPQTLQTVGRRHPRSINFHTKSYMNQGGRRPTIRGGLKLGRTSNAWNPNFAWEGYMVSDMGACFAQAFDSLLLIYLTLCLNYINLRAILIRY